MWDEQKQKRPGSVNGTETDGTEAVPLPHATHFQAPPTPRLHFTNSVTCHVRQTLPPSSKPPQRSCRITGPTKRKGIDSPKIRSSMSKTGCVEKSHPSVRMGDGFCELLRQLITLDTELMRRHAVLHNLDGWQGSGPLNLSAAPRKTTNLPPKQQQQKRKPSSPKAKLRRSVSLFFFSFFNFKPFQSADWSGVGVEAID